LQIKVHYADERDKEISFYTKAATKQVFIDEKLYKSIPLQRVHEKYEVARIKAVIEKPSSNADTAQSTLTFDVMKEFPVEDI
jgi:hypothetical protein